MTHAELQAEIDSLLSEIMRLHADPKAPEYNDCDTAPCNWCERASKLLADREADTAT